ncbi:MAG: ferritin-like domain-containing protein [Acetobacteraceae bacterium]
MATPQSLKDVYIDEMRDLWSGNDQMQSVMKAMSEKAGDPKLKQTLENSVGGIAKHTATIKSLIEAHGGSIGKDHCRGMEGLVREAKAHAIDRDAGSDDLRDLLIIAQYQRMSHYGVAGFGTAAAYAQALGLKDDESKLKAIVSDIYKADEYSSRLAERLERASPAAK